MTRVGTIVAECVARVCNSVADQSTTVLLVIAIAGVCWLLVSRLGY
jgi:hypothetical protein